MWELPCFSFQVLEQALILKISLKLLNSAATRRYGKEDDV